MFVMNTVVWSKEKNQLMFIIAFRSDSIDGVPVVTLLLTQVIIYSSK